jgi:Mycobacterium membrane protein
MSDPRRPERFRPPLPGTGPGGPPGQPSQQYSPPVDPAYADQAPYAPTYGGYAPQWASGFTDANTTRELPAYWQQGLPPSGELPTEGLAPPPPGGPKSPRWLWLAAAAAVLVVAALVIALILANTAIKNQTAVPPLPAMPETTSPTPTAPSPSTRTRPLPLPPLIPEPVPPSSGPPTDTTGPAAMQDVVYSVTGQGRALSIMYIGTGDVVQTEFNVALPWTKEVSLSKSAAHPANVTIVNFGYNVTCSVTVAGVQVSQRVGVGLTVCDARG